MLLKTSTSHEEGGQRQWAILTKEFLGKAGRVGTRGTVPKGDCPGQVEKVSCVKVEFGKKDAKGLVPMKEVPGSEFEIETDLVILAVGFLYTKLGGLLKELGVEFDTRGNVKTDASFMTFRKGVFSAGDMRRGQSLIVWAISEGRQSAHHIDKYLMGSSSLPVI